MNRTERDKIIDELVASNPEGNKRVLRLFVKVLAGIFTLGFALGFLVRAIFW